MFDWNDLKTSRAGGPAATLDGETAEVRFGQHAHRVQVVDETLRDGMQSVSVGNGPIGRKLDLLHAMVAIGVDVVSVGLPAAGGRYAEDTHQICREIRVSRLPLIATAAARTVVSDVAGIAAASQRAGMPIEVYSFIGSSPIRRYAESWTPEFLVNSVTGAAREARREGLTFCLVTEDTTRSQPETLRDLYKAAVDEGAARICVCDTTGHVTPYGVVELLAFVRAELRAMGAEHVELDWHAHNDRGLGLQTALWAASSGVHRVHGTGLGVGERVGNTSLELLVHNLGLLGARPAQPRQKLIEYCELAARALSWVIPADHPIAGERVRALEEGPRPYRRISEADRRERDGKNPSTTSRGVGITREALVPMSMRVNETDCALAVHPRRTLLEALRYDLDLIGTKQGCDKGDCGACTVIIDGKAVLSCLTLALDTDQKSVTTVESLSGAPHIDPLLDCFDRLGGGQCGFCTPGMLMSASALLMKNRSPTRTEIGQAISGNLCRCTGYGPITRAVELAARILRGEADAGIDLPGTECVPPPLASNTRRPSADKPARGEGSGG